MGLESPELTKEEVANVESSVLSDNELLEGGANYVVDKGSFIPRLEVTAEQVQAAKEEMNEALIQKELKKTEEELLKSEFWETSDGRKIKLSQAEKEGIIDQGHSDDELLKEGATFVPDKDTAKGYHFQPTAEQVEAARKEMGEELRQEQIKALREDIMNKSFKENARQTLDEIRDRRKVVRGADGTFGIGYEGKVPEDNEQEESPKDAERETVVDSDVEVESERVETDSKAEEEVAKDIPVAEKTEEVVGEEQRSPEGNPFDRIVENLKQYLGKDFKEAANQYNPAVGISVMADMLFSVYHGPHEVAQRISQLMKDLKTFEGEARDKKPGLPEVSYRNFALNQIIKNMSMEEKSSFETISRQKARLGGGDGKGYADVGGSFMLDDFIKQVESLK